MTAAISGRKIDRQPKPGRGWLRMPIIKTEHPLPAQRGNGGAATAFPSASDNPRGR
jgi:hypothetical protein